MSITYTPGSGAISNDTFGRSNRALHGDNGWLTLRSDTGAAGSTEVQIVSFAVEVPSNTSLWLAYRNAETASAAGRRVQCLVRMGGTGGASPYIILHFVDRLNYTAAFLQYSSGSYRIGIFKYIAGVSTTLLAATAVTYTAGTDAYLLYVSDPTNTKKRVFFNGVQVGSDIADNAAPTGKAAMLCWRLAGLTTHHSSFRHDALTVTVTGLPTGYKARAVGTVTPGGAATYIEVPESGGTATINCGAPGGAGGTDGLWLPFTTLEVRNGAGALVESVSGSYSPGDSFAYAVSNTAPPAPGYVSPAAGATVFGDAVVTWTQGADPDGDTLTHRGETRPVAGASSSWFSGQAAGVLQRALPGLANGAWEYRVGADDGIAATAWAAWRAVTVLNNVVPVAAFSHVVDGYSIAFTDSSTDPDGTIVSRSWKRDGVEFSTVLHPVYIATVDGAATYSLTVTDDDGGTHTASAIITVPSVDDPADPVEWIKNWDHSTTSWARTSSGALIQAWGRSPQGIVRRPSALGRVPLGTSKGWRVKARVLLGSYGFSFGSWHRYNSAELMLGGISVSLDPSPAGKGVYFAIGDGAFLSGPVFTWRGSGRGHLVTGIMYGDQGSETYMPLPSIYAHAIETAYWTVWYTLELDVQQVGGQIRVLGRVLDPPASADIPAPTIDAGGGDLWHMQRWFVGTLDCAYAGLVYRAEWNSIFEHGWVRYAGFEATPYDPESCDFMPPEPEPFEPTPLVEDPEPTAGPPLEKAWAFTHDGHVFYVLHLVNGETLVHDLTTKQWHRWLTAGHTFWNMYRGTVWKGHVLAADVEEPKVWELDGVSVLDEETLPIERVVTAFQPVRGAESIRQGSLRLTARRDDLWVDGATVRMRFSDDGGVTWSRYYDVDMLPADVSKRIEFRSLGRIRAPGRLWEFSDAGGLVRIDGADADVEGG